MLNIVCVNNNNYLGMGDEYVKRLRDGIYKNTNVSYEFHEFHGDEKGWWAKIELFKPSQFTDRVLYFDLDTIITGNIDELAAYDGPFAGLRDFYYPNHLGSGVMAWEAGKVDHIWEKWEAAGKPKHPRGDQQWIESCLPDFVRLQDVYPKISSYKIGMFDDDSVVCFHGKPRPHEVDFNPRRKFYV